MPDVTVSHIFLVGLYSAENAEKIRRWLADDNLTEEHYCQRCGSSLDFPLEGEPPIICSTCIGEHDRHMWSSLDLRKWPREETSTP